MDPGFRRDDEVKALRDLQLTKHETNNQKNPTTCSRRIS
jgi:hypothetical protein